MSESLSQPINVTDAVTIRFQNHPFRFLLYLEWGLLAIAILSELIPTPLFEGQRFHLLTIACMVGFGSMGLRLPNGPLVKKIAFTALEIVLIGLATVTGIRTLRLFPFLYLVLVIRSCLIFQRSGRLAVAGVAFVLFLLNLSYRVRLLGIQLPPLAQARVRPLIFGFALNAALLFGLAMMFVLLLVNALLTERRSREQLAIANNQLRQYALRVETLAMAQERNRIARDIHDSLGHSLTALNIQLEGALKLWPSNPTRAQTFLQEAKRLGSTALREVRQSVAALRADPLQGQSLEEAIAQLTTNFQQTTGIAPHCQIQLVSPLSPELGTAVYRIVQEALTNTWKYAAATAVNIDVHSTPTRLQLLYQDNGRGFEVNQNQTGFGLQGMRERTLALGGQFSLTSAPGQGCLIQASFPLPG
jgi:signal transduction histidine kinase